jgi:hypothetical protein
VLATVENTADRTTSRTLTVTVDDRPVASRSVTLQPNERDEIPIRFEAVGGAVAIEGVEAGRIDTRRTTESDDIDSRSGGRPPDRGRSIAALILAVAVSAGLVVLRP